MSRSINPMCFFLAPRAKQSPASPLPHRLDEPATGYSLAGCSPALPASASPAGVHIAPYQPKQSSTIEQAWENFDRNHFSVAGHSKKVLAETPVGEVQQFMSWVRIRWPVLR
jgi:hypothetical protein